MKLLETGWLEQSHETSIKSEFEEAENLGSSKYVAMHVLIASFTSSLATALILTPFDMVAFKLLTKRHNLPA